MSNETSTVAGAQAERARAFRDLHSGERALVLPNAWDPASARIVEEAGAAAVATTSAGVGWGLGFGDGERLSRDQAIELVARVVATVDVPVTADIEGGFGDTVDEVAATVRGVLAAGAVGINLEDTHHGSNGAAVRDTEENAARIAAVRHVSDEAGVPLFVNARIDTYLASVGKPEDRLDETLERAKTYVAAGADGIFVPGVIDFETVTALVKGVGAPLNVMVWPGAPSVEEFARLGVARISVGAAIAQSVHALTRRAAHEVLTSGTYTSFAEGLTYPELNGLFERRA
ncbi:isocitrate lyase/phosphoenolpyruvate mutase family protein [Streptomyces sp. NPDC057702]|uniref:isocitrate lyase/PEP mutase family protein n=1 Tax=unclassified Streptomyces TaxID=2593676 RepID=UPI00369785FF